MPAPMQPTPSAPTPTPSTHGVYPHALFRYAGGPIPEASYWCWRIDGVWTAASASDAAHWWDTCAPGDMDGRPDVWQLPIDQVPTDAQLEYSVAHHDGTMRQLVHGPDPVGPLGVQWNEIPPMIAVAIDSTHQAADGEQRVAVATPGQALTPDDIPPMPSAEDLVYAGPGDQLVPADAWFYQADHSWVAVRAGHHPDWWDDWPADRPHPEPRERSIHQVPVDGSTLRYRDSDGELWAICTAERMTDEAWDRLPPLVRAGLLDGGYTHTPQAAAPRRTQVFIVFTPSTRTARYVDAYTAIQAALDGGGDQVWTRRRGWRTWSRLAITLEGGTPLEQCWLDTVPDAVSGSV